MGIGLTQKITLLLLGSSLCIALLAPAQSRAAAAITQLEYLQWLVQLSGDTGQFSANSTPSSYVDWARSRSMLPANGFTWAWGLIDTSPASVYWPTIT